MTLEMAEQVAEATDGDLLEEYSGRGMFGDLTAAVIVDDLPAAFQDCGLAGISDQFKTDNMGMRYILY